MRRVIVSEFMSLDGIIEAPQQWAMPFWNDEITQLTQDELFAADLLLLGRVTHQILSISGPLRANDVYIDQMNRVPKLVVSTTLEASEWSNSTIVKKNVIQEISRLKQQQGQDILILGNSCSAYQLFPIAHQ